MDKKINILHLEDSLKDSDFSGSEAFMIARERYARIPFIFVSGTMGEDYAINAMVNGATDYLFKNKLERLVPAIKRAMHEIELNIQNRLAEQDLANEKDLINSLMDTLPDHIYFKDLSGCFIRINKSHAKSLGLDDPIQAVGKHDSDFFSEEHAKKAYLDEQTVIRTGQQIRVEEKLTKFTGQEIWVSAIKMPLFDNKGNIIGTFGISRDITDRINAIELLKHAKEKAEASDNLKTNFLNNISHEVRTPLNGILGFAEIVFNTDLSEADKKEALSLLHESSDRLLNTINNYMDISLIASGNLSVHKKTFFPAQLLNSVFDKYNTICSGKKLKLLLEIPSQPDHIAVYSDPEILQKIMSHLLGNAIGFTENGTIYFGYLKHKTELEFFVRDTGIGIAEESQKSIFEHFIKEGRDPSRNSEGSGLGLSIAKGMIETLGGKIWVESEIGRGSCFFFTIPFLMEKAVDSSGLAEKRLKKTPGRATILVAEDEWTNFFFLETLLKHYSDVSVLHAWNGREAIDIFKANPDIALILMDIKMPEIDGLEATRQIKRINPDIPVIAITAYAMSGDEERVRSAGCDGYLSKPISRKSLLGKMAEFVTV